MTRIFTCARLDFVGSDTARLIVLDRGDPNPNEPECLDLPGFGVLGELNPFAGRGGALGACCCSPLRF